MSERANREIKRRTDAVQCFPSVESVIRLVGAVLVEENINWQNGTRMFSPDSVASIEGFSPKKPTEWEKVQAESKAKGIIKKALEKAKEVGVQ